MFYHCLISCAEHSFLFKKKIRSLCCEKEPHSPKIYLHLISYGQSKQSLFSRPLDGATLKSCLCPPIQDSLPLLYFVLLFDAAKVVYSTFIRACSLLNPGLIKALRLNRAVKVLQSSVCSSFDPLFM